MRNYFWSRAKFLQSVRFCQIFARTVKLLRAKLNLCCQVSRELWNFLARPEKLSRAELNFFAQPVKVPRAKLCVSPITFQFVLIVCVPNVVSAWVHYCSLSASSLGQATLCFAESLSSHFNQVLSHQPSFRLCILMLVNTLRRVDHNLWLF